MHQRVCFAALRRRRGDAEADGEGDLLAAGQHARRGLHDLADALGADEVIDYATTDFAAGAQTWDVVIDTVGNAPYARVKRVLKDGGRLLAVLADLPATLVAAFVGGKHKVIAGQATEQVKDLETLRELATKGALKPVIDQRFPFERLADAYRVVDSGRKKGSVVVSLDARAAGR